MLQVPECKEYYRKKPCMKMFCAINGGLLMGYLAMLLLAMYEGKLEFTG